MDHAGGTDPTGLHHDTASDDTVADPSPNADPSA